MEEYYTEKLMDIIKDFDEVQEVQTIKDSDYLCGDDGLVFTTDSGTDYMVIIQRCR